MYSMASNMSTEDLETVSWNILDLSLNFCDTE